LEKRVGATWARIATCKAPVKGRSIIVSAFHGRRRFDLFGDARRRQQFGHDNTDY
jgi:hypothetical protein